MKFVTARTIGSSAASMTDRIIPSATDALLGSPNTPQRRTLHQITACQECLTNNQPKTRPQWWPPRSIDSLDATPYELEHQRLSVRELMAKIVAAFGTSHSTMLFSSAENWQAMFDHVDRRAPINDFDGNPRSFEELLKSTPPGAAALISKDAQAKRHKETMDAMDRLQAAIAREKLDILIIIGDDQREVFKDNCRPAIAIYYGETIRNAAAPSEPVNDWYLQDQRRRLEEKDDRYYPCHPGMSTHLIMGLTAHDFDITAMKSMVGEQFEGHAYSFIHRRFMPGEPVPIVPVILNTYYPPNQPSPSRCFDLGIAIRELIESFPGDLRVGVMASGGLSHFLVNEQLDLEVVRALKHRDYPALTSLPLGKLVSGSSEIRNWIAVAAVAQHLDLDWISYVPGYRSHALTGVGLCFAYWH
jgi:3-O-methylgallate 3,4-dioxygenase